MAVSGSVCARAPQFPFASKTSSLEALVDDHRARMIRPEACLENRRAAHERLGLGGAAHVMEQSREIVEAEPLVEMIWLKARLVDRKRAPKERFGLGASARVVGRVARL